MSRREFIMILVIVLLVGFLLMGCSYANFLSESQLVSLLMRSFGSSLVALAVISLTWEFFSKQQFLKEIVSYLDVSKQVLSIGIKGVYRNRESVMGAIIEALEKNKGEIKLLGGALTCFLHIPTRMYLLDELIEKNRDEKQFMIKMLLPDPSSDAVARRDKVDGGGSKTTAESCVVEAKKLYSKYNNKASLKNYCKIIS